VATAQRKRGDWAQREGDEVVQVKAAQGVAGVTAKYGICLEGLLSGLPLDPF
jgi:hypothetical protein